MNEHAKTPPPAGLARELLPCVPCLYQLLTDDTDEPHVCELSTARAVEAGAVVEVPEECCPCPCQQPRMQESEALRIARAEARRAGL